MLATRTETPESDRELVISIDFDGCIFHLGYIGSASPNRLFDTNELFLQHVVDLIKNGLYSHVTFMVGSNRQSKYVDNMNAGTKGSCFPALIKLCKEIQRRTNVACEVDGYLLADSYGNVKPGENFAWALANKETQYHHFVWDPSKYSIVYAQMHKKASEWRNKKVDYYFYDDREEDILSALLDFYNQNKILTPENVCAHFYKYDGKELRPYSHRCLDVKHHYEIQGNGIIDDFYYENIKHMAVCAGFDPKHAHLCAQDDGISKKLYGEKLKRFINERKLHAKDLCTELNREIFNLENASNHGYIQNDYRDLIAAMKILARQIEKDIEYMVKHDRPENEMDNSEAVLTARAVIKMLRNFLEGNIVYTDCYNYERNKVLVAFVNTFGKPLDLLRSSSRMVTRSISSMFYRTSPVAAAAYDVAEKMKPLLISDEYEHEELKEAQRKKYSLLK